MLIPADALAEDAIELVNTGPSPLKKYLREGVLSRKLYKVCCHNGQILPQSLLPTIGQRVIVLHENACPERGGSNP